MRFFRAVLSPRVGTNGSAASSVPPPHHVPIGIETNAVWNRSEHRDHRDEFGARGSGDDVDPRTTPGAGGGRP